MERRFLLFVVLPALVVMGCGGSSGGAGGSDPAGNPIAPSDTGPRPTTASLSTGLTMPVRVDDINLRGVINPLGVVRSSLDRASLGRSRIDVALNTGAPIFAVGAGWIVSVRPSIDSRPGDLVKLLLAADSTPGNGWVFLYEHVTLLAGFGVDSVLTRDQPITTNTLDRRLATTWSWPTPPTTTSCTRPRCWVDQLDGPGESDLVNRFNTALRTDPRFIATWQAVKSEARLPSRELLNTTKYPDGARLCYPTGTDNRVDPQPFWSKSNQGRLGPDSRASRQRYCQVTRVAAEWTDEQPGAQDMRVRGGIR